MPIKSVKMKISKTKMFFFFIMSQGSLNPKMRSLGQKLCSVARVQTDRQTHTKVTTVGTLSGFQEFSLQSIIKDQPNKTKNANKSCKKSKVLQWVRISLTIEKGPRGQCVTPDHMGWGPLYNKKK